MARFLASLLLVLAISATAFGVTSRKLTQLAPISEFPPGVVEGIAAGLAVGERIGREAALAALELVPAPEGEEVVQTIPTGIAAQVGGQLGAATGAVAGAALGATVGAVVPSAEAVELAPGIEATPIGAGALLGATLGAEVGRLAARETVTSLLAPVAEVPSAE